MNLTKSQKLEAYTYALLCAHSLIGAFKEAYNKGEDEVSAGTCINLDEWGQNRKFWHNNYPYSYIITFFPEFKKQEPFIKCEHGLWWDYPFNNPIDHHKRIAAIERAIHLTEQLPD